jgi:hypothetical protein
MGPGGLEPPTSRLSGVRSSQLSYEPDSIAKTWQASKCPVVGFPTHVNYIISKEQKKTSLLSMSVTFDKSEIITDDD